MVTETITGDSPNGVNNKWVIEPSACGCILTVIHTCMHRGSYYFAASIFAEIEIKRYESQKCLMCHNNDEVERVKQLQKL